MDGVGIKQKRAMSKTLTKILWPRRVAEGPSHIIRVAGGTGGLPGLGCAGSLTGALKPGSLVKLPSRERNGAFDPAARAGEKGRGSAGGPKSGGERRIGTFNQGASTGGAKSCRVWRRSLSRGSQTRQGLVRGEPNAPNAWPTCNNFRRGDFKTPRGLRNCGGSRPRSTRNCKPARVKPWPSVWPRPQNNQSRWVRGSYRAT